MTPLDTDFSKINPAIPLAKEVRQTRDIDEVIELLGTGKWIVDGAIRDLNRADSVLFFLSRTL